MEKNPSPSPRYILLRSIIHRILTTVGTGLSFRCCKCQIGLEEWSPKWKAKNVYVTLLWHFNLDLFFLQDRSRHINWFSMCCSYMAQDKMNWTAVGWRQFTSRSPKLVIHWRQMGIPFLLTPKEDLPQHCHLCTHDWWHSQPTLGSVHHTDSPWEGPSTEVEVLKYFLSLPTSYGLTNKKLDPDILILFNHVIISHRHWDI